MIFDSLNECLDYKRKGGIGGLGLKFSRKFKPENDFDEQTTENMLKVSKDKVVAWAKTKCGTMMEKEPVFSYQNDTEGLDLMRERIMNRHLNEYIMAADVKWLENTDEFLEVFLVLSDFTFETLVEEVVQDLRYLSINRKSFEPPSFYK